MRLSLPLLLVAARAAQQVTTINNTAPRLDVNGVIMDAHDLSIRQLPDGTYVMHAASYGLCVAPARLGCDQTPDHCGFRNNHNVRGRACTRRSRAHDAPISPNPCQSLPSSPKPCLRLPAPALTHHGAPSAAGDGVDVAVARERLVDAARKRVRGLGAARGHPLPPRRGLCARDQPLGPLVQPRG